MTRINKVNKRSVKKSTPVLEVAEPELTATLTEEASYKDLQAQAKALGLKASGSKVVLVERILNA